jgi:hypothetical protein
MTFFDFKHMGNFNQEVLVDAYYNRAQNVLCERLVLE